MKIKESRILKFARGCYQTAQKVVAKHSSKFSKKTFDQWQHIVLNCMKKRFKATYRDMEDFVLEMPEVRREIGMDRTPDFSTMDKAFFRLRTKVVVVMIAMTSYESGIVSIDSSGFKRSHISEHYAKRSKIRIKAAKVTLLVDSKHQSVVGIHATATRKHDSKIVLPVIKNTDGIRMLIGDKGYDDDRVREELKQIGVRPIIMHREFNGKQKVWNAMIDKRLYHQRSKSETVFSAIKRKYDDELYGRSWQTQLKEIVLTAVVYNIDRLIKDFIRGIQQS